MRVILDTNILVSALLVQSGAPGAIYRSSRSLPCPLFDQLAIRNEVWELFGSGSPLHQHTDMISDEMLMLEFQAGSREPFDELFARYKVQTHAFFRRRVQSSEIAEDLAQETWMAVLKSKDRYQPVAPFRTYLYGIAFKVLAGERRRNRSKTAMSADEIQITGRQMEAGYWVRAALQKLDAMDREILMLREYEELSYSEIAELLQVPINTVRSRLFRARLALKQILEPTSGAVRAQVIL